MYFREIIDRIKLITGYSQKEIASEIFGISDKNLSNKIKRGSIDLEALMEWTGNEMVDLNWLLTGSGISSPPNSIPRIKKEDLPANRNNTTYLDHQLLKLIISGIEKVLEERKIVLDSDKKAEAITLLYEMYFESNKHVSEEMIERYLRLVA